MSVRFDSFSRPSIAALLRVLAIAIVTSASTPAASVRAQTTAVERAEAAAAYDRGATAYRAHDYAAAAEWFEQANQRLPSNVALVSALRAHRGARAVQRAGTVALQLDGEPELTAQTAVLVRQALAAARPRFAQVDILCSETCLLEVDGAAQPFMRFFAEPNRELTVIATFASGARTQRVTGRAGVVHSLAFDAPDGGPAAAEDVAGDVDELPLEEGENPYRISRMRFLSRPRATFFTSLASTVAIASITTWSAGDAHASRDDASVTALAGGSPEAVAVAAAGHARDVHRTRGFVGFTSVMIVLTGAVAALTDWSPHGSPTTDAALDVTSAGAELTVRHRF